MPRLLLTPALPVGRQLRRLRHEMLENVFDALTTTEATPRTWLPASNLIQRKEAYELQLALPGVPKEHVQLAIEGELLVIRGERPAPEAGEHDRWWMAEIPSGTFERRFRLPEGMTGEGISARHEDGLLRITLPVATTPTARVIPIEGGTPATAVVTEVVDA
ncbi:MAG: Hsp20/alpha crystallin family protein [Candidatus Sericytochromatia bacterium]|nr:Hsp20/alpha crystallin family protein [Candidatus Sericytochromatia bacterium]